MEGPLATVRGGNPEEAEYPGVASQLPRVWIAVRKRPQGLVEHLTVADVANAEVPATINALADDRKPGSLDSPVAAIGAGRGASDEGPSRC